MKRRLAIALFVAAACGGSVEGRSDKVPSTASAALTEATCATCHAKAVEEWRGSMHHASFTSEDFQRSYQQEPRAYCVGCHAPLADKTAGIGCTACHAADQRHASRENATHATTKPCQSCHDFDVPGAPTMLQGTAREHRASAFAERTCESCHMQRGGSHRFDVTRNRDFLARAIHVSEAHLDAARDELVVRVASHGVGHRFPTGDLFRRLTVVVAAYDHAGALRCAQTFYLRRDVDEHRERLRAKQPETSDRDTRLDDTPRDLRLACAERPARVHVNVTYERGAGGIGDDLDAFATLDLIDEDIALRP